MDVNKNESGNIALIAVAVVVGLVVGFAVARVSGDDNKTDTTKNSSTSTGVSAKADDLRANLVTLGVEHMSLTNTAVDQALDGSKSADASAAALYKNGDNIGAAVGSVYGKDAEKTFDSVWRLHLDEFVKYAVASSKGDVTGKSAALNAISTGYTKPLSQYLAKVNPNLPEATLEKELGEHVAMTAAMIDDHTSGKYADEYSELQQANQHIASIMSTLAGGIAKQKGL